MDDKNEKIRLNIGGMTCVNCQNKIEKTLDQTEGVISARISYSNGAADIVYNKELICLEEIIAVIEHLDYEIIRGEKTAGPNITNIVCTLAIIVLLYVMRFVQHWLIMQGAFCPIRQSALPLA